MNTHRIAVNAYLINRGKFLLLKRAVRPFLWSPPGGRLEIDEDPVKGLQREIFEETGLSLRILMPVTTWFGKFNQKNLLSIDYLCTCDGHRIILSHEHTEYKWLSMAQLTRNRGSYLADKRGFRLQDFQRAWRVYLMMNRHYDRLAEFDSIYIDRPENN